MVYERKRKDPRRSDESAGSARKRPRAPAGRSMVSAVRRPALQIREYPWQTLTQLPIKITDGVIFMVNTIDPGTGDDQRSKHQTMLYKMSFNCVLWPDETTALIVAPFRVNFWLVYDAAPQGKLPALSDIFSVPYTKWGNTWNVSRTNVHRFVVKRKWHVDYNSSGTAVGKKQSPGSEDFPVKNVVECNKFFEKLRVKTEWLNTTDGTIGSVKKGALYLVANTRQMPAGDAVTTTCTTYMQGSTRLYFKSLGYQ
ncbi:coat protein [Eragrostis minor streak virus]|uniref:Capsid protein n=1 Tax=Eragrostis minor streak virus TaxID=1030595 RepID=F6M062_9GEMI|nr:coat protein [Eragrostis minor streak virus]AEE92741.1 coat protein [Eragrostis minor streak virus]AIY33763.1 capsid protein [Eragrostis minor streak virus]AIY33768.1 capsid protein [Eragrostis minor streak virus]